MTILGADKKAEVSANFKNSGSAGRCKSVMIEGYRCLSWGSPTLSSNTQPEHTARVLNPAMH